MTETKPAFPAFGPATKRPVTIQYFRWTGDREAFRQWMTEANEAAYSFSSGSLFIATLEGDMKAGIGDYIVRGVKGEFDAVKPDIFEETYTPAAPADAGATQEQEGA